MSLVKRNHRYVPAFRTSNFPTFRFFSDSWLDEFERSTWSGGSSYPAVNVQNGDKEFRIELAAPGLKKEDLNIELDKDVLTIKAERSSDKDQKGNEGYVRREFAFSSFERSFNLPENVVDEAAISANFSDGILHVVLPKREEALPKPARTIDIG